MSVSQIKGVAIVACMLLACVRRASFSLAACWLPARTRRAALAFFFVGVGRFQMRLGASISIRLFFAAVLPFIAIIPAALATFIVVPNYLAGTEGNINNIFPFDIGSFNSFTQRY